MLQLFKKYKFVLRFILTFLGSYFLLSIFYNTYLELSTSQNYYPDFFTHLVALQSESVLEAIGYSSKVSPNPGEPSMILSVNKILLVRIVEGCNSISIIILFTSFVLAFVSKLKKTLLFIFVGSVIIYVMNVIRIAILAIGIFQYPQHTEFLHEIFFPLVIYGTVFILWVIWVRLFSKNAEEDLKQAEFKG